MKSKVASSTDGDLVALTWLDLCGIARVRGIPLKHLKSKEEFGLSFPSAGQAMTMFGGIVDNPWGSLGDVRQRPIMSTLTPPSSNGLQIVLSEAMGSDGGVWGLCTRTLLRNVVAEYERELGWKPFATFEHEFKLFSETMVPPLCMTLEALRIISPLDRVIVEKLEASDITVEAFEPEYAPSQYEISCAPKDALRAADEAVLLREIVRDCAREAGYKATFSPKTTPDTGGSGLHIHMSFTDAKGKPTLYDENGQDGLSKLGGSFVAGILKHARALLPFVAPGVISYYRLGPGKWSSGYAAHGISNREAMLRLCSLPFADSKRRSKSFNIEFRSADGLCNPYLALAMILRAGLEGIRKNLAAPEALNVDPAKCPPEFRETLQALTLPNSLELALGHLDQDHEVQSWLSAPLLQTFLAVRQSELDKFKGMEPLAICEQYMKVY